jgi:colanic acid/amylovoran biosynthesis glycosyltransferase
MKTLAIFSPNFYTYSETFIQAHKKLPFDIKFYYGGWFPDKLEGVENIYRHGYKHKFRRLFYNDLSFKEYSLLQSLKSEGIDYVLVEYGPTACELLTVLKKSALPTVVHFFGFDAAYKKTIDEYGEKYKDVFQLAKKIIVVSKRMKKDLIGLGCPEEKLIVSVCGPNKIFFDNTPSYSGKQFISVGRFTDKKAPYITIVAFQKVLEKHPDATLVMCGDGELWNSCKNLVKVLNISDRIIFEGVVTPEREKELMEKSIAFLQHSITADNGDSEGTPVAILEAQAAALPVISTYHAGIPDVVIDGETGFLVEEKDAASMASNMIRILNEQGLAKKLGVAARKRIHANFTLEAHLNTLKSAIVE